MGAVQSNMLPLGSPAPAFALADPGGAVFALADFRAAPALVVAFLCNHCPYVKHIRDVWAGVAGELQTAGAAVVAINSNDIDAYPDDAPARMVEEARAAGYTFPYLYDETQDVAKAYSAACTPDFYVFDSERTLVYRGQFDASRPRNDVPVTGSDLRAAVEAVLDGRAPSADQVPSMGCGIKWRPGNAPDDRG